MSAYLLLASQIFLAVILDSDEKTFIMVLNADGTGAYKNQPVVWNHYETGETVINIGIGDGACNKFMFAKDKRTVITIDTDDETGEIIPVFLGFKD